MLQTDIEDDEFLGPATKPIQTPKSTGITVSNKALSAALARAVAITGHGMSIPILECVRLQIENGALIVEANNMEQMVHQRVPSSGYGVGVGCVKGSTLHSIVQRLPADGESVLEFTPTTLTVKCGRSRVALELVPLADYPIFASGHSPTKFTMKSADLALLVERTRPFVSTEETRYYLGGIYLAPHIVEGITVLRAAATNGHWLGVAWTAMPDGAKEIPGIIIPRVAIPILAALLEDGSEVRIEISQARAIFTVGEITFATKLVDATYPDIDRVMPRDNQNIFLVDQREFLRALSLTGVETGDKNVIVRLSLSPDAVTISSGFGANQIVHELPIGSFEYDGAVMEIGFMNRLLVDPTKLAGDRIEFRFNGPEHFASARDPADHTAIYVIGSYRI